MSKYPRIGRIDSHRKNTCAKCFCGEIGKAKVHLEYNWFRGEDEVVWACVAHIKDADYLADEYAKALKEVSDE